MLSAFALQILDPIDRYLIPFGDCIHQSDFQTVGSTFSRVIYLPVSAEFAIDNPRVTLTRIVYVFFLIVGSIFDFAYIFKVFCLKTVFFELLPPKNHAESFRISIKNQFWIQSMQNSTNSRKSDMSGPAKTCPGGQVLTANQRKYLFLEITPFHFYSQIYNFSIKSSASLNKCIVFYKIMCFTK